MFEYVPSKGIRSLFLARTINSTIIEGFWGASKGSVGVVGVRNGHQSVARRPCGSPSGSQRQFRVVGLVARASKWVSRPCNMSVGVPNVHVKVYNMLIPHNNPNV
jgi:hypothetical protein